MTKINKYFKSMDDVKKFLKQQKKYCSDEQYCALKELLGLSKQKGKYVEVEGIGKIDESIADLVKILNSKKFITLSSCSGIKKEHPKTTSDISGYISFFDNDLKNKKTVKNIANKLNLKFEEVDVYLKPSYTVRVEGDDEYILKIWKSFENLIYTAN